MKTYQETVESFVPAFIRSRNKNDFYNHSAWCDFVNTEKVKIETAAFIFNTTYEAICKDIREAANK